jgi:hypothetical protein
MAVLSRRWVAARERDLLVERGGSGGPSLAAGLNILGYAIFSHMTGRADAAGKEKHMKRVRVLAILLCASALVAPLASISASDAECAAYPSCAGSSSCGPDETCVKRTGQVCGVCIGA